MKKFIKSIPVYLTVVMLLCSLLVVQAFATSDSGIVECDLPSFDYLVDAENTVIDRVGSYNYIYYLPVGRYSVVYGELDDSFVVGAPVYTVSVYDYYDFSVQKIEISSDGVFVITPDMLITGLPEDDEYFGCCQVMVNSYLVEPVVSVYNEPAIDAPSGESPVLSILDVWAKILNWMADAFDRLTLVFYSADTGLTFIGYLAVGALAVAVVLLLLGLVRKWLRFGR